MPIHTKLKGVEQIGQAQFGDILKENFRSFFNWGLLEVGSFFNVRIGDGGAYGGDFSQCRLSSDRSFESGQVWETSRHNWVYESGLEYSVQPTMISGVYINNNFVPTGTTGTYEYSLDYNNGRIIFTDAIPVSSDVNIEYSHKYFGVYSSDDYQFRNADFNSFRVDDNHFLLVGSGDWEQHPEARLQMPSMVFSIVPQQNMTPYEIGNSVNWLEQDILVDVYAETSWDRNTLRDILTEQKDKTIKSFNVNSVIESGRYPLNASGDINTSGYMYPQLVEDFFWQKIRFSKAKLQATSNQPPLYTATVRLTCELLI